MMPATLDPPVFETSEVTAIVPHLSSDNEVVRCAAARALNTVANKDAAPALVEALMDPDPDARTDAMEALVNCARAEDATPIRRSLLGDPVKEVKAAAIDALARLGDKASLPLFRDLAADRSEHSVAWEDDAGMWDDWLDVQIKAICALGNMGDKDAVDVILEACRDEMGQELEEIAFPALAKISGGGTAALLGLLRHSNERTRSSAIRALLAARREVLEPMADLFAKDASPIVRALSLRCMTADNPCLDTLSKDIDASVRLEVMRQFGFERLDIALDLLADMDPAVKALALTSVVSQPDPPSDLWSNAVVWLETGKPVLAIAAIQALHKLEPDKAREILTGYLSDDTRDAECRVNALSTLSLVPDDELIDVLQAQITSPMLQMRAAALAALSTILKGPSDFAASAEALLIAAIEGELEFPEKQADAEPDAVGDAGASRVEDEASSHITITREGDIVQDAPPEADAGAEIVVLSTLGSIQSAASAAPAPDKSRKKHRRIAVDGPDVYGDDLRINAIAVGTSVGSEALISTILDQLDDPVPEIRAAAFRAIPHLGAATMSEAHEAAVRDGLADEDPTIRANAATLISSLGPEADLPPALADDPDPFVRVIMMKWRALSDPDIFILGLLDPSAAVRDAAMTGAVATENDQVMQKALEICLREGHSNLIQKAIVKRPETRAAAIRICAKPDLPTRELLTVLDAFHLRT